MSNFKGCMHFLLVNASIITDENVQALFMAHLRGMKDENRTPELFMRECNDDLFQKIPNSPIRIIQMLRISQLQTVASNVVDSVLTSLQVYIMQAAHITPGTFRGTKNFSFKNVFSSTTNLKIRCDPFLSVIDDGHCRVQVKLGFVGQKCCGFWNIVQGSGI